MTLSCSHVTLSSGNVILSVMLCSVHSLSCKDVFDTYACSYICGVKIIVLEMFEFIQTSRRGWH